MGRYTCSESIPHAMTSVTPDAGIPDPYVYDANPASDPGSPRGPSARLYMAQAAQSYTPYDENGLPLTPVITAYFFGGAYKVTDEAAARVSSDF